MAKDSFFMFYPKGGFGIDLFSLREEENKVEGCPF